MPRISMGKQIESLKINILDLTDTNYELRQAIENLTVKLNICSATLNGRNQAVGDLKALKSKINKELNKAQAEISYNKKYIMELEEDAEISSNEIYFLNDNRGVVQELIRNAILLLYPHLESREFNENTDILDPNDRLLLKCIDILEEEFNSTLIYSD